MLHEFPEAIGLVQRSLKNCIQTYEPRLKNVQVRHLRTDAIQSMVLGSRSPRRSTFPMAGGRRSRSAPQWTRAAMSR